MLTQFFDFMVHDDLHGIACFQYAIRASTNFKQGYFTCRCLHLDLEKHSSDIDSCLIIDG
jgi:hypothetical protein